MLYYLYTSDFGKTWQNIFGDPVTIPLKEVQIVALVKDYNSLGLNVYINDLTYYQDGGPSILNTTNKGYRYGPENDPMSWFTARFTGSDWEINLMQLVPRQSKKKDYHVYPKKQQ